MRGKHGPSSNIWNQHANELREFRGGREAFCFVLASEHEPAHWLAAE